MTYPAIVVPGRPVSYRGTKIAMIVSGGQVRRFPVKQANAARYQEQVRKEACAVWAKHRLPTITTACILHATARFHVPKGATKQLREAVCKGEVVPYLKRFDTDNWAKNVQDGLKAIGKKAGVILDDQLFWKTVIEKVYGQTDEAELILQTEEL